MNKMEQLMTDLDRCDEVLLDTLRIRTQIVHQLTQSRLKEGISTTAAFEDQTRQNRIKAILKNEPEDALFEKVYDTVLSETGKCEARELFGTNLYLIGFMGAGKSTVSKTLQDVFHLDVIEMDQIIAEQNGMSIPEIFQTHGEEYFRNQETNLIRECAKGSSQIISCGGGVVMRPVNVEEMKKNGRIVLLQASPETILERVKDSHERPLLENSKTIEHISALMEARRPAYEQAADLIVSTDGKSALEICDTIVSGIQSFKATSVQ